jgi:hypothetical protein
MEVRSASLYDSTGAAMAVRVPARSERQLETLAVAIVGISQSVAAHRGTITRAAA